MDMGMQNKAAHNPAPGGGTVHVLVPRVLQLVHWRDGDDHSARCFNVRPQPRRLSVSIGTSSGKPCGLLYVVLKAPTDLHGRSPDSLTALQPRLEGLLDTCPVRPSPFTS